MKKSQIMKAKLEEMKALAQSYLDESKVDEAKAKMAEIENMKAAIVMQEQLEAEEETEVAQKMAEQSQAKANPQAPAAKVAVIANSLRAMIKAGMGRKLTEAENALLLPADPDTVGTGYLLPEDIRTTIQKKIRDYSSFRDVLGYIPTTALSGSFTVEDFETLSELVDFTDGTDGTEGTDVKFKPVAFSLKSKGALITLSNTLLAMTDNNLVEYIADIFAKKAVITENKMAIAALATGKSKKAIAGWKALQSSINKDIDEGVKYGLAIVTNQDGFDYLDNELDETGRAVLQPDPTSATRKLFKGYPVKVFSNSLLPTVGTTTKKAPIIYGNLKEAVKFVDNDMYSFATSEAAGFKSNTTIARVIEHVDVVQIDDSDAIYIYGEITTVTGA